MRPDSQKLLQELQQVNLEKGLSQKQVENNRFFFGKNVVEEMKLTTIFELVIDSIKEPMMVLLLSVATLSFLFGKDIEAFFMIFVVFAYIGVECINKFRSDRTLTRLKTLTQPITKVIRAGGVVEITAAQVVVGDVILLYEGVILPADVRLVQSYGLLMDESSLTGESAFVKKEEKEQLFAGTTVVAGEGKAIVSNVGKESQWGSIAYAVQTTRKEKTLIQEAMSHLVKILAISALVVSIVIPFLGYMRGLSGQEMILTWLALTFLMVPGQPPVIITMALSLASFELSHKKIIVKRLRGVEGLGQVSAVISDKTGTVTENKMKVAFFITPEGAEIVGEALPQKVKQSILLALPEYCTDPTDSAVAEALGIRKRARYNSVKSFSVKEPWRALVYQQSVSFAGQAERLVAASSLPEDNKKVMLERIEKEASTGNRVIAFAEKISQDSAIEDCEFLALAVLFDPVRSGVQTAIETLQEAQISTYMVTGDHPATAHHIGAAIGLQADHVLARVTPLEKLALTKALQQQGEVVAVIGDGINDAPALHTADVGIAMGQIGTDVAKETADVILTDDNFIHIPDAIAIGRKALHNFRKGLTYYLTAKAILLFIFLVPLLLGVPFPFHPIQIIMTELLMDLASSTIFVTEEAEPDEMKKPPPRMRDFLNWSLLSSIAKNGLPLACGIVGLYLIVYYCTHDVVLAQTTAFVTWLLGHIMLALNLKQEKKSLREQGLFANRFGFFWLVGMILLSLAITQISFLYPFVHTTTIPGNVWAAIIGVGMGSTWWIEGVKIWKQKS